MTGRCEHRENNTDPRCGHEAVFTVSAGGRRSDEQLTCRQHLARTAEAFLGAEALRPCTVRYATQEGKP